MRETLGHASQCAWVAELDERIVGFVVAAVADEQRMIGEITMLAVDPAAQRRGVGSSLTEHALGWLRDRGMHVAMVETGGDAGHADERRVYEGLGFRSMSISRYFRALSPS